MTIPDALRPVVAVTQARVGSTRLPAKVLRDVAGKPMLWWHLARMQQAKALDRIIVATTDEPGADGILRIAEGLGIECVKGPVEDVLGRFDIAIRPTGARTIVRVTSDCPLIDPTLIDAAVQAYADGQPSIGYAAIDVGHYPRGLDCEVFGRDAFDAAVREATDAADREHVTLWIRHRGDRYPAAMLRPEEVLQPHRWCVDTPEDMALVEHVLTSLGTAAVGARWCQILTLVEAHPDWMALNRAVVQKN
jgi:spore coat polysaccharide biosynthesis protein SpsF